MAKLRLFIGLPIPKTLADKIEDLIQEIGNKKIRRVKKENLHITVLFLGYVEEKYLDEINLKLGKLARALKPFELTPQAVNLAPPSGTKRMVWVTFSESKEFSDLANNTYNQLGDFSQQKARHQPLPHITLAKSKTTIKSDDLKINQEPIVKEKVKVKNLILFRSKPTRGSSNYFPLSQFPLGKS